MPDPQTIITQPIEPTVQTTMPSIGENAPFDLRASSTIQGNILAGFRKDHQVFAFLKLPDDSVRAQGWLAKLTPRIAATREVAAFNARFSAARRQNGGDDPENLQSKWVNIGLTATGLQRFGSNKVVADLGALNSDFPAFMAGAANSATKLGDVAPDSDPSRWLVGGPGQPTVDVILTVAADDVDDLLVEMEKLRALATEFGLVTLFEQRGNTLPAERAGHEHFGFKDGISQPSVSGFDTPAAVNTDHANGQESGASDTETGSLTAAGEFILGYPREGGAPAWPCPEWMKDGSFQVWRRLEQDVPGFWGQATAQLPTPLPSDDPATADWLAARLMGRWRSGTPVDSAPDADDRSARDPQDDDKFNFTRPAGEGSQGVPGSTDSVGVRCPLDAHIRKMNPRDGQENPRRLIRRGIPFGLPFDPAAGRGHGVDSDRGLLFMAFMSNIENQFEFLQQFWANGNFPGGGAGPDPIIGAPFPVVSPPAGDPPPTHTIQRGDRPEVPLRLRRFVYTTGAVYAFAPSLAALRGLAAGTL